MGFSVCLFDVFRDIVGKMSVSIKLSGKGDDWEGREFVIISQNMKSCYTRNNPFVYWSTLEQEEMYLVIKVSCQTYWSTEIHSWWASFGGDISILEPLSGWGVGLNTFSHIFELLNTCLYIILTLIIMVRISAKGERRQNCIADFPCFWALEEVETVF